VPDLEYEAERARRFRAEAEEAAEAVEIAWRLAGLPSSPNVMPVTQGRGIPQGPHVSLGGCHASTARALADVLTEYARLTGRLIDGESHRLLASIMAEAGAVPALSNDGFTSLLKVVEPAKAPWIPALVAPTLWAGRAAGAGPASARRPGGAPWGRDDDSEAQTMPAWILYNDGKHGGGTGSGNGGSQQDDSNSGNKHGGGGSSEGGNTSDGKGPADGK
jgi:hypothetical protein